MKTNGTIHVVPAFDTREHQTKRDDCWCEPDVDRDRYGKRVIHNLSEMRDKRGRRRRLVH